MQAQVNTSGKSIRLFLVDGTPQGMITLEVVNWTGHVIVAPRSKITELIKREEMSRTGVYLLSGPDPEGKVDKPFIYIGESDNVGKRLAQHNKDEDKQFWERACLITSKDQNLTKAHAKYLESRLIAVAEDVGSAKIINGNAPVFEKLPEADIADMEYFINQIRLVLPVLGLDFLRDKPRVSLQPAKQAEVPVEKGISIAPLFEIHSNKHDLNATAAEIDGEFVVFAGSNAQSKWIGTESHGYHSLYKNLFSDQKIANDPSSQRAIFKEDVTFNSPSAAAAIIFGRASNGRTAWKLKGTSKTYQDWQEDQINRLLS